MLLRPFEPAVLPAPGDFHNSREEFAKRFGTDEQILNFAADNLPMAGRWLVADGWSFPFVTLFFCVLHKYLTFDESLERADVEAA